MPATTRQSSASSHRSVQNKAERASSELKRDFWPGTKQSTSAREAVAESLPLLGRAVLEKEDVELMRTRAICRLERLVHHDEVDVASEHAPALAAVDYQNELHFWLSVHRPPALPQSARYALLSVLCSAGYPGLQLLWGSQENLLAAFRERCAKISDDVWRAAAAANPQLRQLLAFLWAVGRGADSALCYTDTSSRSYQQSVIYPLLAVVGSQGLDGLRVASRLLAVGQSCKSKHGTWVSSLERSCRDPDNFLSTSPMAAQAAAHPAPLDVLAAPPKPNAAISFIDKSSPVRTPTAALLPPSVTPLRSPAPRLLSPGPSQQPSLRPMTPPILEQALSHAPLPSFLASAEVPDVAAAAVDTGSPMRSRATSPLAPNVVPPRVAEPKPPSPEPAQQPSSRQITPPIPDLRRVVAPAVAPVQQAHSFTINGQHVVLTGSLLEVMAFGSFAGAQD